jgi:signal peptidase I
MPIRVSAAAGSATSRFRFARWRRRPTPGTFAVVCIALAWLLWLRPVALGGTTTWVVIRGDSMEPTFHTGDLVIVDRSSDYAVGEVVAYRVPEGDVGGGSIVIHRLVGGDQRGFDVRGDNNGGLDPWRPTVSDIVGRAWLWLPGVGHLVTWIHQPLVAAGLAAAVVVALILGRAPARGAAPVPASGRKRPEAIALGEPQT